MAFRKTYRSNYFPSPLSHGFGEPKFSQVSTNGSSISVVRVFETCDDISKSCLPLVEAATVIQSGQLIKGTVDFAPTDRAHIDARVNSVASDYISKVKVESPKSE